MEYVSATSILISLIIIGFLFVIVKITLQKSRGISPNVSENYLSRISSNFRNIDTDITSAKRAKARAPSNRNKSSRYSASNSDYFNGTGNAASSGFDSSCNSGSSSSSSDSSCGGGGGGGD